MTRLQQEEQGILAFGFTRREIDVALWSLDYHWHRITRDHKGNPSMLEDVDRLRKQIRRKRFPHAKNSQKDTSGVQ